MLARSEASPGIRELRLFIGSDDEMVMEWEFDQDSAECRRLIPGGNSPKDVRRAAGFEDGEGRVSPAL